MDLVECLPDFYRKEDISSNQDASALSAVVCVPLFSSSVVNSNPNLDVGASAVFWFLNPSVSFSERSKNPLIPQILQSESLHGKRSSGLQRSRRGCSDQSQTVREIDSHKSWRAGLRRGGGATESEAPFAHVHSVRLRLKKQTWICYLLRCLNIYAMMQEDIFE